MKHAVKFLIIGMSLAAFVFAGGESDARAVGMGRAQTAIAENTEAYYWNPANLGINYKLKPKLTIYAIGFGVRVANNVFSSAAYNHYNGKKLTVKDKKTILKSFGGDPTFDFNGDAEVRALGVQYRNYSFAVGVGGGARLNTPKEVFDIILSPDPYTIGSKDLRADGKGGGDAIVHVALAGGFPVHIFEKNIREIAVGTTVQYYYGIQHVNLSELFGHIEKSDSVNAIGRVRAQHAAGGNGFGVNFGISAQITKDWFAGISCQNLFSNIAWSTEAKQTQADYSVRSDDIFGVKKNKQSSDTTINKESISTEMPRILRVGAGYQITSKILLAMDFEHYLNSVAGKASPRLSTGAEFKTAKNLLLRTGMSVGGDNRGFNLAGGLGWIIGKTTINIATNNLEGIVTGRRFSFSLDVKVSVL